jgi:hypothetical protein
MGIHCGESAGTAKLLGRVPEAQEESAAVRPSSKRRAMLETTVWVPL